MVKLSAECADIYKKVQNISSHQDLMEMSFVTYKGMTAGQRIFCFHNRLQ